MLPRQRWPEGPQRPGMPHPVALGVSVVAFAFALALIVSMLWGCSGSSPSEVPGAVTVETAYGSVTVVGEADLDEIRDEAERGMARVHAQGYPLTLDGVTVYLGPDDSAHGRYLGGGTIYLSEPKALDHEIQHWAASELGRTGECRTLQDHRPGYDLDCRRLG